MKKRIIVNKTKLFTVALITLMSITVIEGSENSIGNNFQPVPSEQISGVLNMISAKAYDNYSQIQTWQGSIDANVTIIYQGTKAENFFKNMIDDKGEAPKKIKKRRESTIEFAANFENGLFYSKKFHRKGVQYTDPNSGKLLKTESVVGHNVSIGTADYKISCHGKTKRGDNLISRAATKKERVSREDCPSCGEDIFDPRSFLLEGQPLWEFFPQILQYIQKHGDFSIDGHSLHLEERRDGTITEYRIEIPGAVSPGKYLIKTMVFSSEEDFNVTLVETKKADGKLFQKKTWDYEVIDGIYLPKKTTKQSFRRDNAELSYERECIFSNYKLNQTIPEHTFTYKNLGLQNGDKFRDKILDKEYIYQDGELIPTSSGSSHMLKETNPVVKKTNKHCKHCRHRHKWKHLIELASHWLVS